MRVFLDFEASSLDKAGYPIEIGWVFEDGRTAEFLIKPAPDWMDWDETAEAIHGITREQLQRDGTPHDVVAKRLVEALTGHALYASAPSWDGKWLSVLLRGGGFPRHLMRLKDTEEAFVESARAGLGRGAGEAAVTAIVAEARRAVEAVPITHRALGDAQRERQIWLEVARLVLNDAKVRP